MKKEHNLKDLVLEDFATNKQGWQILTDQGWSNFEGVLNKGLRITATLQLSNTTLIATLDHKVFTDKLETLTVGKLLPGVKIHTRTGIQKVVKVTLLGPEPVYDLLNVEKNRRFYADDVLCSNCEFIIADSTLIAPAKLIDLEGIDPVYRMGDVRWYKQPEANRTYVIALDPSLGTGNDPAAIQIYEAGTMEQVAEWKNNKTPIPQQVRLLADICKYIYGFTNDVQKVYYSVENNNIGEAALISIDQYGEENIQGYFLSDPTKGTGRYRKGFNTGPKSKMTACSKLKTLVEENRMKLNSKPLISELKTFVSHGMSYAAKPGETDDLVMATILAVRMLQLLQTYDPGIDKSMRDHGESYTSPMPFITSSYGGF
jgi:hypothetical protein